MIIKERQIALIKAISWLLFAIVSSCDTSGNNQAKTLGYLSVSKEIAANIVHYDSLILNQFEGKWYYEEQPFNGHAITHYANGEIASDLGFFDGKKEGVAYAYYEDGAIKKEAHYVQNRLDGKVLSWWPNKELMLESNYILGVRHGVQKKWYPNGQLATKVNINKGKEEGLQQAWLENGKIYVNYEAKNGRTFGLKKANLCYELEDEVLQN